ncbi:cation:proton antiporter [Pigmentibacter sp. JX0631]|uniref:cation:proton antiporter domain-containing protein n=1 Tax=Pigmentibacter sp. JX0631 TaxID=2976982 RepID=UPI0024686FBE|nr:cation:proton antiporter [Pigmentibacter sp. JX0631]WGL60902.1 cation:proton antiporter [Pigmentibacter sp. JX0631]
MTHIPQLIIDLAVILGVAAVVTYVFRKINQPVVLGYIVAGIIVGPYTHPFFSIVDVNSLKTLAELGVIFLMFALGLEFSFRRLAKVGISAAGTAIIQIIFMISIGLLTAKLLGWSNMDSIFLGCMVAISSTTIIIKAFEELGLKNKRFAELVFGILIVEDLAAILMLVALTNISMTASFNGLELLIASGKLAVVVGAWFLIGMFLVPRFVKKVGQQKNNEMLVVVAIGLCLGLVALASYFNYSVALGAFIMGSIIAESPEAKHIEHLVQPLKDLFGAVFFVSVGMLLDPNAIINNFSSILLISFVIIFGKLSSVTVGSIITGQRIPVAVQSGFSLAQIGEFSFIIATLGTAFKVIDSKLYPIIVAASTITTFTTPYLIKYSLTSANKVENLIPKKLMLYINNYINWFQKFSIVEEKQKTNNLKVLKWVLNLIVVITIYSLVSVFLEPQINAYIESEKLANFLAWLTAFVLGAPSTWAMLNSFTCDTKNIHSKSSMRGKAIILFLVRIITLLIIGFLSLNFIPSIITLSVIIVISFIFLKFFRRQVSAYYIWFEDKFKSNFNQESNTSNLEQVNSSLAPWDAHLIEILIPYNSFLAGKKIFETNIRDKYGVNIVGLLRNQNLFISPQPNEIIFPQDILLCFATDEEIEKFKKDLEISSNIQNKAKEILDYCLQKFIIKNDSIINGKLIKDTNISEKFHCTIVGIERNNTRIKSPKANCELFEHDILWIVGENHMLEKLRDTI